MINRKLLTTTTVLLLGTVVILAGWFWQPAGILVVGDSTMKFIPDWKVPAKEEVSTYLQELLKVPVVNHAVSGERTDQMRAGWGVRVQPFLRTHRYVILQGGINDFTQGRSFKQIQNNLLWMAQQAEAAGVQPIVMTVTPGKYLENSPLIQHQYLLMNQWIKKTFQITVDAAQLVGDPQDPFQLRREPGWYGDGLHYGTKAKQEIAYAIAKLPLDLPPHPLGSWIYR